MMRWFTVAGKFLAESPICMMRARCSIGDIEKISLPHPVLSPGHRLIQVCANGLKQEEIF